MQYLSSCVPVCVVDSTAASMAGRVVHHTISSTHWVIQRLHTVTFCITVYSQILTYYKTKTGRECEREDGEEKKTFSSNIVCLCEHYVVL